MKIVVIGTYHASGGACTPFELINLVNRISPEAIFCEVAPELFSEVLLAVGTFKPPEIEAIRTIIKTKSVKVLPIDLNENPFDNRLEEMFEFFKNHSREYSCATELQIGETYRLGHQFINSKDCDRISKDKELMESSFVTQINLNNLSNYYNQWIAWNDKRENHWIKTIHQYMEENEINLAVFLVGAAHRTRLMDKIHIQKNEEIQWDFYPYQSFN